MAIVVVVEWLNREAFAARLSQSYPAMRDLIVLENGQNLLDLAASCVGCISVGRRVALQSIMQRFIVIR
jgi:hypothetical protein